MKILLADNNPNRKKPIVFFWQEQKMVCDVVEHGCAIDDFTAVAKYDAIVIGSQGDPRESPDKIKALRDAKETSPIIILQDVPNATLATDCLNAGADSVLCALTNPSLLLASIRAITRRMHGRAESLITIGVLQLNETARTLYAGDQHIHLSKTEHAIIALIMAKSPYPVTYRQIISNLYGDFDAPNHPDRVLKVMVCKLRKKLKKAGAGGYIQTKQGFGFFMVKPAKGYKG